MNIILVPKIGNDKLNIYHNRLFLRFWPTALFRSAFLMPTSRSYPKLLVQFHENKEKKERHLTSFFKANNLKITNVALLAMLQGFPRVTKGYQKLPKVTKGYQRLPKVTKGYQRLPKVTKGY